MRSILCRIVGHRVSRTRRFFLTERSARCERCGERVPVKKS